MKSLLFFLFIGCLAYLAIAVIGALKHQRLAYLREPEQTASTTNGFVLSQDTSLIGILANGKKLKQALASYELFKPTTNYSLVSNDTTTRIISWNSTTVN